MGSMAAPEAQESRRTLDDRDMAGMQCFIKDLPKATRYKKKGISWQCLS